MESQSSPFQEMLVQAEIEGRVLHREDIYGSGPPVDAVSEEILEFVGANVGESVLDVGCGLGPYVHRLGKLGKHVIGVDVDLAVVEQARTLGRDVRLMSATNLEFADDSFDSIIMIEVLEHLPDYESALAEAVRVARQSIVLTVPDISAILLTSQKHVVPWHLLEATHVNFFTPEILRKVMLRYADSCQTGRLGPFFDVDGKPVYTHAAAVARLLKKKRMPYVRHWLLRRRT